jgi:hypothetical protein
VAGDDGEHLVAVALRVGEALQHHRADRVPEHGAARRRVERPHAPFREPLESR